MMGDKDRAEARYEHSDVDPRKAIWTALGLLVGIGLSIAMVGGAMTFWGGIDSPRPALTAQRWRSIETPRLEVAPGTLEITLRQRNASAMEGYGWVDEASGRIRIPITRAMDILAERGWPDRADRAVEP